ncbi:MFS transporter [Embleya hyalina]|uniref:MFS transporter n=1 Tax=Embleya hyalina TaxID=516124 RepID=A0A401YVE2_9ACTN|nr:MFS transporter [Embleya hyalina]GCD98541.1 MFS transporter [Embleya hyalina]
MTTTHTDPHRDSATTPTVSLKRWLAVIALAVGTFSVVTVEQLPVGLLTSVGGSLGVSEGLAGLMVTVPGLVAAATAPILPVLIGRLDRRLVLLALITLMVVATLGSAFAPNFAVLLVTRFLVGIGIGGFWALAAGLAVRLVPEAHIPRAVAITFGGATAANVLGVPAGTLIGNLATWRVAFLSVAALGLLVITALVFLVPPIPAGEPVRLRALPAQFRNPAVRTGVLATFLLVSGHFAAFTFVGPVLEDVSGLDKGMVGPLLLGFGIAGIAGNFLAGTAAARNLRGTIVAISAVLAGVLALFPLLGTTRISGAAMLLLWGLAFGGVPVSVQTWILRSSAAEDTEAATALNTSMFNLAIALGALLGGIVVDAISPTGILLSGAVLTALTSLAMWRTRRD